MGHLISNYIQTAAVEKTLFYLKGRILSIHVVVSSNGNKPLHRAPRLVYFICIHESIKGLNGAMGYSTLRPFRSLNHKR